MYNVGNNNIWLFGETNKIIYHKKVVLRNPLKYLLSYYMNTIYLGFKKN